MEDATFLGNWKGLVGIMAVFAGVPLSLLPAVEPLLHNLDRGQSNRLVVGVALAGVCTIVGLVFWYLAHRDEKTKEEKATNEAKARYVELCHLVAELFEAIDLHLGDGDVYVGQARVLGVSGRMKIHYETIRRRVVEASPDLAPLVGNPTTPTSPSEDKGMF